MSLPEILTVAHMQIMLLLVSRKDNGLGPCSTVVVPILVFCRGQDKPSPAKPAKMHTSRWFLAAIPCDNLATLEV